MNRENRKFFRLNIGLKVFIKKVSFNRDKNSYLLSHKWSIVNTKDISASGMFILRENFKVDLSENDNLLIKFVFPMYSEPIYLIGKINRKDNNGFAINFIIINERDRDKLVYVFYKLSYEKNIRENNI